MAVTTTRTGRHAWSRVLATGAVAGTALLTLALPASAHTPNVSAACADGKTTLNIDLKSYNGQKDNTVKATDGDTTLVDTTFTSNYDNSFDVSPTADHTFTVTVVAWDDKDGKQGFSFTKSLTVKACVEETTTPPPSTTTTVPTTTTTSVAPTSTTSAAPPVVSSTPAPPADQGGLASTGASVGLPLTIGALLLVGGGALLLVVRRRRGNA